MFPEFFFCNWVFIAESWLCPQWISMNLKGLSGGGREIKLDFYNQKAIKTCRNPCTTYSQNEGLWWVYCCKTFPVNFTCCLLFAKLWLAMKTDQVLVLVDFHAFLELWFIHSQRSERTKNIGWGWEGFVACEGNQVKVGRRDAKHRAKEGCDADLGLYFVTLSSRW